MNNNLLVIGVNSYNSVVLDIAKSMNVFDKITFLNENDISSTDYQNFTKEYSWVFISIANPHKKLELQNFLMKFDYNIATLISPSAFVASSAKIGEGTIIEPMALIHSNTVIGDGCVISAGALIDYNVVIGKGCHIDCRSTILSDTIIAPYTKILCGSILQRK